MPADAPHPNPDSEQPSTNHPTTQAVVLRHTLPDSTEHYDWFIEIPNRTDEYRLRAFRSETNPASWHSGQLFHVEHSPDHRAHYLSHEGPIGQDRGSVQRVATGVCEQFLEPHSSEVELRISWKSALGRAAELKHYWGKSIGSNRWEFRCD